MSKLILTDIDDTILRFVGPFQDWLLDKGYEGAAALTRSYSIESCLGISFEAAQVLMSEFGRTDIMKNQPYEPDALAVLPKLHDHGYRFVGITACGTNHRFANQRRATIEAVFGFPFEAVHFVEPRSTKADYLSYYRPTVWVEDNYHHAEVGAFLDHKTFLIDRPYNINARVCERVTRVKDWVQISDWILENA